MEGFISKALHLPPYGLDGRTQNSVSNLRKLMFVSFAHVPGPATHMQKGGRMIVLQIKK